MLFIDGDHTYQGVKADYEQYSPLVRKGGIIVFHDIAPEYNPSNCGVWLLWRRLKNRYDHRELVNRNRKWPMGVGVLYV